MQPRDSKREVNPETFKKIAQYQREGLGATRIRERLYEDQDVQEFPGTSPEADRQKIQRILSHDLKRVDHSGPWSFAQHVQDVHDPAAARHALDVLAYVIERSERRIDHLTNQEADWIIRLRTAYPEMPEDEVWETVRSFIQEDDDDHSGLDVWLAFQPWRSEQHRERYLRVVVRPFAAEMIDTFGKIEGQIDKIVEQRPELAEKFGRGPNRASLKILGRDNEEGSDDE